jgi:hypothetical protein
MTKSKKQVKSYLTGFAHEYDVEKVMDKKISKGKIFYLLKWKHYPQ